MEHNKCKENYFSNFFEIEEEQQSKLNDNFVSVFDQIFNPSNCFAPTNIDSENYNESLEDKKNQYLESSNKDKIININKDDSFIEQQIKDKISSFSDEKIVLIMKELYIVSETNNKSYYKINALLLIKKLLQELKDRIYLKLQNLSKNK